MKLLLNTTSPYARLARIALLEKSYTDLSCEVVDPWADAPSLLAVNSAARVPSLMVDERRTLNESLLIVMWLEHQRPTPSLLGPDALATLSRAGAAMGVIDAAVHTLIGRKCTDASFDDSPVGLRRRRSIATGLTRLEADPPAYRDGTPDLAVIATVVALDYVHFRFPHRPWVPVCEQLEALARTLRSRPSFEVSAPRG